VIEAYRRVTGRSVDSFEFYRVLSVFRTAIVFLQLFERYRQEPGPKSRLYRVRHDRARPARVRFRHRPRPRRVTAGELTRVLQLELSRAGKGRSLRGGQLPGGVAFRIRHLAEKILASATA
jgi:hypothetical protein